MRRPRERLLLCWACSLLILFGATASADAAGEYRTVEVESVRITFDSEWAMRTAPGYLPIRIDLANSGEPRILEIAGQSARFFRGRGAQPGALLVRQVVRLPAGGRVRLTLPVPVSAHHESIQFQIREGGRTLQTFHFAGFESGSRPADAAALIVADPASAFGRMAVSWPRQVTTPAMLPPGASPPQLDFLLQPARLPTNWIAYTSLRAVVLGPTEWEQLDEAQKNALLAWTACGGDLILIDAGLSALFASRQQAFDAGHNPAFRGYFFGRIHLGSSDSVSATGLANVLAAADRVQDPNWALPANSAFDWGTMSARGFRLPIPGVAGVPARAYLLILLLFGVLIGPVNYWFLWRRQLQVLLVLTVPLISAGFIVLLAGYVLAGEGLAVYGRAVTITILDQARQQASTRASVSLYAAGMTPSQGLRFARDTAVFPIGTDGSGSRDRQTLDLSDAQRFTGGLIQARAPANVEQIVFRPARERLSFSRDGRGMSVVNGLGATVAVLLYRDGNMLYSSAAPLPPGAREVLRAGGLDAPTIVPADTPLFSRFVHLVENQPPGSYLALLDRSPFWEPGVSKVVERGSFHIVVGWPGGQP